MILDYIFLIIKEAGLTCLDDLYDYLPILSKNFDLFSKYQVIVLTGIPVAPFG
jgi:hypothetical protein